MGYSVPRYRVALTMYSSLVASLGGWLYVLQTVSCSPTCWASGNSTNGLVYALIGGVDTILGPLLGAAVLRCVNDQLSRGSTPVLAVHRHRADAGGVLDPGGHSRPVASVHEALLPAAR